MRWASWAVVRLPCVRGSQQARQWKVNSSGGQECVSHRALPATRARECGSAAFTGMRSEPFDALARGGVGAGGVALSSRGPPHAAARGSGMGAVFKQVVCKEGLGGVARLAYTVRSCVL